MITATNIGLQYGSRKLFEGVNITFSPGNCYGLIGANGSGKSTFLKILSGEIESTSGDISIGKGKRMSVLKQDQFAYDEYDVLTTVLMGHKKLYDVMTEKDAIYAKPDFSDADGIRASELEGEFAELDGWNAESDAGKMLANVGITDDLHRLKMKQLEGSQKVKVLLAQALFGSPDILLLDEPTNQLDVETCMWLEEFLIDFENTAIVVSHDRHFLDKVCTHVCDIDFGRIQLFPGNYSFWAQSSELALRQKQDANKKIDEKRKELQSFIARFSANASKSRQATSRKKILENLTLNDIKPSSRKYPYIGFESEREAGNELLHINHLSKSIDGQVMFKDITITIEKGDKVAFVGRNDLSKTTLFQILIGKIKADEGTFKFGASTSQAYFPKENSEFFQRELSIIDWLRQFSKEQDEQFVRGFLGRMLFSGDEGFKSVKVLSGGEKVRCMFSRMMMAGANVLLFDEPTNHLDLESISALNKGMNKFNGTILFSSHDHELVQTVANRIIEITPNGYIDKHGMTFDDYLADETIKKRREELYQRNASVS